MAFPSSPCGTRMRQRCTVTPREKVLRTSVSASVPSGNCGFTLSVVDSSIAGTFQRTSYVSRSSCVSCRYAGLNSSARPGTIAASEQCHER